MKYKKDITKEEKFILSSFLLGKNNTLIGEGINCTATAVGHILNRLKKEHGIKLSLMQVRRDLLVKAVKAGGSYPKAVSSLNFRVSREVFDRESKNVRVTCENCKNEAAPQEEMKGRPCKAVAFGFPPNGEDGICLSFDAIDLYFVRGTSNLSETGYTRLRGNEYA
jgi:hypothetical protein